MHGLYGCCMHTGLAHHVLLWQDVSTLRWHSRRLYGMLIDVAIREVGPCDK